MNKKIKVLLCLATTFSMLCMMNIQNTSAASGLKVHYIDVGSGDAIYLECDGQNMLIDGGYLSQSDRMNDESTRNVLDHLMHNDASNTIDENASDFMSQLKTTLTDYNNSDVTRYLDSLGVKNINYIISSHPHFDHLGGLLQVVNQYTYDHIYYNGRDYSTRYYRYFRKLAEDNVTSGKVNAVLQIPQKDETFQLGGAKVTILSQQSTDYSTISGNGDADNNGSLVIRLDYGKRSFLFTGDIQVAAQQQLIQNNPSAISGIDILKVPHHGHTNNDFGVSSHSGNYEFFAKTNPVVSIVQCGTTNTSVTIPTQKVRNDLSMSDIYTTKSNGNIVLECDGKHIDIKYKNSISHAFVTGDINGDGKITPSDYVMARRQILGTLTLTGNGRVTADINGDGKVTPSDYVLIRRHILGTYHIQ